MPRSTKNSISARPPSGRGGEVSRASSNSIGKLSTPNIDNNGVVGRGERQPLSSNTTRNKPFVAQQVRTTVLGVDKYMEEVPMSQACHWWSIWGFFFMALLATGYYYQNELLAKFPHHDEKTKHQNPHTHPVHWLWPICSWIIFGFIFLAYMLVWGLFQREPPKRRSELRDSEIINLNPGGINNRRSDSCSD